MSAVLEVADVSKAFGGNRVLDQLRLQVASGEIVGLLGPNGSGKSTVLNTISGFLPIDAGEIRFNGQRIDRLDAPAVAALGVRRTFQLPSMPTRMSVLEVAMAASIARHGAWDSLLRPKAWRATEAATRKRAHELLASLLLDRVAHLPASSISGGQKKLLGIACAMMTKPALLLLDEPTAGVHPNLRGELVTALKSINEHGVAILVIEHDMHFIGSLCDRCVVIDRGSAVADCHPSELANSARVVEAYLGGAGVATQTTKDAASSVHAGRASHNTAGAAA